MAIIIIRNQNFVTPFKASENVPLDPEEMFPQQVVTPVKNKNAASSRIHRRPQDYKVGLHCLPLTWILQSYCRICGERPSDNKYYSYEWKKRTRE